MAYADPLTVDISGTPRSFVRVASSPNQGKFRYNDEVNGVNYELSVDHQQSRSRNRHTIRLTSNSTLPDPFLPSQNRPASISAYLVVNANDMLTTATDAQSIAQTLVDFLDASSGAALGKLVKGEV